MMLLFWKKLVDFFKKYWQYAVVFGVGVGATLFLKKKQPVKDDSKVIRDSYDNQINQINDVRQTERDKQDDLTKKLESDLTVVEKQYEEQKKNLDEKKKEEIKVILQQHRNDPIELAKKLSEVTGFKVIMPEE